MFHRLNPMKGFLNFCRRFLLGAGIIFPLISLGMEPRAPFPKGHVLPQGDWSLLDPVRARGKIWRDA